jgi:hypothetical protein
MARVHLTITSRMSGRAAVVPYSHEHGLQTLKNAAGQLFAVVYIVPAYEVRIEGGATYAAVRFGLQNDGKWPVKSDTRRCDAGLYEKRTCTPSWDPTYSPHSFQGTARKGAWILLPGKGFLIHEGPDRNNNGIGGSLGCVEILDGKWNAFLQQIEKLGGGSCASIGAAGTLTVSIEAGSYPIGSLYGPVPIKS